MQGWGAPRGSPPDLVDPQKHQEELIKMQSCFSPLEAVCALVLEWRTGIGLFQARQMILLTTQVWEPLN